MPICAPQKRIKFLITLVSAISMKVNIGIGYIK